MSTEKRKTYLIIGITGGLAQLTATFINQNEPDSLVIGIDSRDVSNIAATKNLKAYHMKYSKGHFENIFREYSFDVVYHLARLTHTSKSNQDLKKRLELNVVGTKNILDLCKKNNVKKVILLSTFHVYGAFSDNSIFLNEDSPLRASIKYPELRDVVEMDQICSNWLWQNRDIQTILLRPCNIIGANLNNSMTKFLLSKNGFHPMDYNPMFQFIHEFDMANILFQSSHFLDSGIYNVAPDDYISLKDARKIIHGSSQAIPITLIKALNSMINKVGLGVPEYLIDYLKFSCLINNQAIKLKIPDSKLIKYSVKEALQLLKISN